MTVTHIPNLPAGLDTTATATAEDDTAHTVRATHIRPGLAITEAIRRHGAVRAGRYVILHTPTGLAATDHMCAAHILVTAAFLAAWPYDWAAADAQEAGNAFSQAVEAGCPNRCDH